MRTHILCGSQEIQVEVPDDAVMIRPNSVPALLNPIECVQESIDNPMGSAPLAKLAQGCRNACVVISDITRPVPNKIILPPILDALASAGIKRQNIIILIATGMHRPNQGKELESMVGADIMTHYRIENHYCRKGDDLRKIAEIDGADIELNKYYLDADLKILTGLIEPHMYAGYSGGRKSILPGISSYNTMTFMHSFAMIDHPNVTNCKLQGNPFHTVGERVAELAGVDFIVNAVINRQKELVGIFAGHHAMAHKAGCDMVSQMSIQPMSEPADLVVTSAGGYPLDATFYQVSKGLIAAADCLRENGSIIMACECREGLGSDEYTELVRAGRSAADFIAHCRKPENFKIDQWCLQTTYQALAKAANVYVYSPYLNEAELKAIGIFKIDDIQTAVRSLAPTHPTVAVSPEGPYAIGLVAGGNAQRIQKEPYNEQVSR